MEQASPELVIGQEAVSPFPHAVSTSEQVHLLHLSTKALINQTEIGQVYFMTDDLHPIQQPSAEPDHHSLYIPSVRDHAFCE